ncbi:DegT/DnrJ/EryC1/StrS family aminotransferase [Metaplanococcus flavidus]|uniref:DegT/DnrJ/EryC1/StrS family aminotransferase n=1 Tax=Metaplanococcus flavidus TaxID=569883 RepID=A0ABW3LB42_9BACL
MLSPFENPIYVTRPLLPDLENVSGKLEEIWESKQVTNNGKQLTLLSKQLQEYLQAQHLSIFNNGTLALLLGLKALGLKGEVITTPFTFPATVQALDWNQLTPVFCDIDRKTLNIDANKIESLITENTSAILAVHVFGNPCETEKIQNIADKYGLKVIYDGAHAFGAKIGGNPISSYGDMTMFSFHATKLFNTVEGGALTFRDGELVRKLDLLKNFGLLNGEEVVLSGLNAKMNEIQAGIGLEVLKIVEEERKKRHRIKKTYEQHLAGIPGIRIITNLENEQSSYQYFVIEIDKNKFGRSRDWLQKKLTEYNVFTRKYFYPLCSEFDWYTHLESAQGKNLPVANKSVEQVLSLPFYGELELDSVTKICRIFQELHITQETVTQL